MLVNVWFCVFFLFTMPLPFSIGSANGNEFTLINKQFSLTLNDSGKIIELIYLGGSEKEYHYNHLVGNPFVYLKQSMPYKNEHQLTKPSRETVFYPTLVKYKDGIIYVEFSEIKVRLEIACLVEDDYMVFELINVKVPEGRTWKEYIDEITFIDIPLGEVHGIGEWLNAAHYDEHIMALISLNDFTFSEIHKVGDKYKFRASVYKDTGLKGKVALVVKEEKNILGVIGLIEEKFNLPLGAKSRQDELYKHSYMGAYNINRNNVLSYVEQVKKMGLKLVLIYYRSFAEGAGHFKWNEKYKNGLIDLKYVVGVLREHDLSVGLHFHYNKVDKTDSYVTPIPDPRLNSIQSFTLSKTISLDDDVIYVEQNPDGLTINKDRSLLRVGREIISYQSYSKEPPYKFKVLQRGALGSNIESHDLFQKLDKLDVDTWPLFIRIDQSTSLQEEISNRIAEIYNNVGFDFAYFDGAEDVGEPYWYNVGKSQLSVYNKLIPRPRFSEGAAKTHFSWHILSRANAFDLFEPNENISKVNKWPVEEAANIGLDLSKNNFGWLGAYQPKTRIVDFFSSDFNKVGTQPSTIEYTVSRAAAWNSPFSVNLDLTEHSYFASFQKLPRKEDIFEIIKNWEYVRVNDLLSDDDKKKIRESDQEYILLDLPENKYSIVPYEKITGDFGEVNELFSYYFEFHGEKYVVYWHPTSEDELVLDIDKGTITLFDRVLSGENVRRHLRGRVRLPLGHRRYLKFKNISKNQIFRIIKDAI